MPAPTRTGPAIEADADPDSGHLAHIVAGEDARRALVEGTAIVTLCGRWLVPSRDPSRLPRCPRCLEILDRARNLRPDV